MRKIQCEIIGLSTPTSAGGAQAIVLKEVDGNRRLPIIIGAFEAHAISLELEHFLPQRPLTHDLIKSIFDTLGALVPEIIIDDLHDSTFYAKIIAEVSGMSYEIDARPSDAIAVAVRMNANIFVAESVLDKAGFDLSFENENEEEEFEEDDEDKPKNVEESIPKTKADLIASLQAKLKEALDAEEYERAAKLRDDIKKLTNADN